MTVDYFLKSGRSEQEEEYLKNQTEGINLPDTDFCTHKILNFWTFFSLVLSPQSSFFGRCIRIITGLGPQLSFHRSSERIYWDFLAVLGSLCTSAPKTPSHRLTEHYYYFTFTRRGATMTTTTNVSETNTSGGIPIRMFIRTNTEQGRGVFYLFPIYCGSSLFYWTCS